MAFGIYSPNIVNDNREGQRLPAMQGRMVLSSESRETMRSPTVGSASASIEVGNQKIKAEGVVE